ncbi:hypothetical protein TRFO_37554 [Tritrichomonas foetus]|uniref:Uncharacterized protein n=1 Tax=Tritrichomonas foetus TaxID=1144522 RepID=A0A1J4JC92_9EUKA|nr:hypothetical protein TRFO_37554 [Tritrichomonas foetus]|eukprot:OHS96281.1 hypothetical protein TRFO_37554 [Tritrichomonas foetus]
MGCSSSKPEPTKKNLAQWKDEFPDYVTEAEHIIGLQELLFNLTDENMNNSITIMKESYLKDSESIGVFINNLILAATYRTMKSELYAKMFSNICENVPQVKNIFLDKIFLPLPESSSVTINSWGHLRLVHYCIKNGCIEPTEICRVIRNMYYLYPEFVNLILFLFAYFCKEIDETDHQLYSDLYEYYNQNIKRPIHPLIKEFLICISNYQSNNWKLLTEVIENGYEPETIAYRILHGEVPELPDYSMVLEPTLFAQCPIIQTKPTLLQFCAYFGLEHCFFELIEKGADQQDITKFACAGGNSAILSYLKDNSADFSKCLPISALYHRYDIFEFLASSFEYELQDSIYSCAKSNNIKSLLFCFDNGVDIITPDEDDFTPLHYACISGSYEAAHLLSGQPDVDSFVKGKDDLTPLILASKYGHKNIVSLLLGKKGVSVKEESNGKMNALHYASIKGHYEAVSILLSMKDCDINYQASNFSTALHYAAQNGHAEVIRILNDSPNKLNVNIRDKMSNTPLHLAASNGYTNVVQILLTIPKIDMNPINSGSKTPLIIATENEFVDIVDLFLHRKGVNRNIEDKHNVFIFIYMTAVKYATKSGNEQLIRLFRTNNDEEDQSVELLPIDG